MKCRVECKEDKLQMVSRHGRGELCGDHWSRFKHPVLCQNLSSQFCDSGLLLDTKEIHPERTLCQGDCSWWRSSAWTMRPLKALWWLASLCWRRYSLIRQCSKLVHHSNVVPLLFNKNVHLISAELSLTSAWGLQKVLWLLPLGSCKANILVLHFHELTVEILWISP